MTMIISQCTLNGRIYGSRHLARKWESEKIAGSEHTLISCIETMILLDLLGAESPNMHSFFESTDVLFDRLAKLEQKLTAEKLINLQTKIFNTRRAYRGGPQDDHIPFDQRGVPVLHLIAAPFPPVWHKVEDDMDHIHQSTVMAWSMLLRCVVAEYMRIDSDGLATPPQLNNQDIL